jgi:hypothetical protein
LPLTTGGHVKTDVFPCCSGRHHLKVGDKRESGAGEASADRGAIRGSGIHCFGNPHIIGRAVQLLVEPRCVEFILQAILCERQRRRRRQSEKRTAKQQKRSTPSTLHTFFSFSEIFGRDATKRKDSDLK